MIIKTGDTFEINGQGWQARHRNDRVGGPDELSIGAAAVMADCSFYLDDMNSEATVLERCRCFRKSGVAIAASSGYFPFGAQVRVTQTARYAARQVRVTFDLQWPAGAKVRRHFGVYSMKLPGRWQRFFCLPPATHLAEGQVPAWQDIPEPGTEPLMIGHWHRPPLALVFQQADGNEIEIGCGDDIWRWENCLGHGPESGSYKVFATKDGLNLTWEPLMCCAEFMPAPREYRFSWYAAWDASPHTSLPAWAAAAVPLKFNLDGGLVFAETSDDSLALHLDLKPAAWPAAWRRAGSSLDYARNQRSEQPCLECTAVQKRLRRLIRQLRGRPERKLLISGLEPGPCWDPAHLQRRTDAGLAHWDLPALLDFASWARQCLGADWDIHFQPSTLSELPSMRQLFTANGFGNHEIRED